MCEKVGRLTPATVADHVEQHNSEWPSARGAEIFEQLVGIISPMGIGSSNDAAMLALAARAEDWDRHYASMATCLKCAMCTRSVLISMPAIRRTHSKNEGVHPVGCVMRSSGHGTLSVDWGKKWG
jgi:hypothetical protein